MRVVLTLLSVALLLISADSFAERDRDKERKEQASMSRNGQSSQLMQAPRSPRISTQQAASMVKNRYAGSRVLGVTAIANDGSTLYRVRTLSGDGVVKSVFVDGRSGEVFE